MSVLDIDKIDGLGIDSNDNTLVFLISDHLPWESAEYEHLQLLQQKINSYIRFIQSGEYKKHYPEKNFEKFRIEVGFKHFYTDNVITFFALANSRIKSLNIDLKYKVVKPKD